MTVRSALQAGLSLAAMGAASLALAALLVITLLSAATAFISVDTFSRDLLGSAGRTLIYAVLTASLQVAIAIAAALYCMTRWPLNGVALTLLLVPYFLPSTLVHAAFKLIFLPDGIVASTLAHWNVVETPFWFTDDGRFVRLVLASIWQFWPFAFLLAMARLLAVPPSEARAVALAAKTPAQTIGIIALRHLIVVTFAIFLARLMFMAAKFDLPYLSSSESGSHANNLLTVEILRALASGLGNMDISVREASGPTFFLIIFAIAAALAVVAARLMRRGLALRVAPEAGAHWLARLPDLTVKALSIIAPFLVGVFVLLPLAGLLLTAFTTDNALRDGWQPLDTINNFTFEHFLQAFGSGGSANGNWMSAFGRTMILSGSVAAASALLATVAGAWLAMQARSTAALTQLLAVVAFGIPTTIWAFAFTVFDAQILAFLPQGVCIGPNREPSFVSGCGEIIVPALHLIFTSAIAIYMALAFWTRSTHYAGLRLLLIEGVDARKPQQLLRALWLSSRQQARNVFYAVFPVVFAVSWSDITFSRYFIMDDGQRLFTDLASSELLNDAPAGTMFGQMGVAALLAFAIAAFMASLVRRSLK